MSDINALRTHLFETLKGLKDGSIDVEKAKAVTQVADCIIDSAKVEVDFLRVTGANGSTGFIPSLAGPTTTPTQTGTKTVEGVVTTHKLRP